jgi:pyrroline-5-carboxylate reductase
MWRYLPLVDKMVKTSVIGCGNMGSAFIRGIAASGRHSITAIDLDPAAREAVAEFVDETTDDLSRAADADVVIVAVKPDIVGTVLDELDLTPEHTLVSGAAGVTTDYVSARTDAKVVRMMPNLATEFGEGAVAVTWADEPDADVRTLLDEVGTFVEIDESLQNLATAVNGSGPAFVFYLLEAMKQVGVEGGFEPDQAEDLAAQTFKGAAEIVLQADRDVDELIDAVCSEGGTTIEGMRLLWDSGVQEQVADAVRAADDRAEEMSDEFHE